MSETIGQQLKKAREARGLTVDQAARALHIRPNYLIALEEDRRKDLPSSVQGKGFLRMYVGFLELPIQPVLDAWEGRPPVEPGPPPAPPEEPAVVLPPSHEIKPAASAPRRSQPVKQPVEVPAESKINRQNGDAPLAGEALLVENVPEVLETEPVEEAPFMEEASPKQESPQRVVAPPPFTAKSSFYEIGQRLKQQRLGLGLSIAEVERYTHVRQHYLEALEEGRIENLPSPVQGRGMLSNYAHFLNLDVDGMLLQFAEGLQSQRVERLTETQPARQNKKGPRPVKRTPLARKGPRRLISPDLLISALLVLIILGFALWTAAQVDALNTVRQGTSTPPSIADVLLNNPTSTLAATGTATLPPLLSTLAPGEVRGSGASVLSSPGVTITVPANGNAPVQVYVIARQRAYLRITADDKVAFDGRVEPGNAYPFSGDKKIELLTGSAAALQVFYNQKDLGVLGLVGQVKAFIFTKDGAITPTPQFTASPTRTTQPTSTRQPSATLPTSTITPYIP